MSNKTTKVATDVSSPFSFQPLDGGDVELKSCDGKIFRVHSVLLGMASTVFADMFMGATKPDTIELAEDSESISLMLAFIYPVAPPQIDNLDLLEKFMIVGQKYNIDKILKYLEQNIHSKNSLILLDPIRVFRISVQHNFPAIQLLAAKSLNAKHCDLLTVDGLLALTKIFPNSAKIIGLVGAQGARVRMLSEFLLRSPLKHGIHPRTSLLPNPTRYSGNYAPNMACSSCLEPQVVGGIHYYKPGWFASWNDRLYSALLLNPMDQCEPLFGITRLPELKSLGACSGCVATTLGNSLLFDQWAQDVKRVLQKELDLFDALYSL